jgi:hypothetical protein
MAFPENPAAINFAREKAGEIREFGVISGESKNVKLDREMQERYKHHWPAGGDKALYGVEDTTLAGRIASGSFPPIV